VKLPKLHVLEGNTSASSHSHSIACIDEGVGGCGPDSSCTTGCEDSGLGLQCKEFSGFHLECNHTDALALVVHEKVERHPFNKELGSGPDVSLVKGVQQCMPSSIRSCAGALDRLFPEVGRVATEGTLVDGAVWVSVERHSKMLELVDHMRRLFAHELDGVLIAEVIRPLDGVEHVPVPVVFAHVSERGPNATLRCNRVGACWKDLGQHRNVEARLCELQRTAHAGATRSDNHCIKAPTGNR